MKKHHPILFVCMLLQASISLYAMDIVLEQQVSYNFMHDICFDNSSVSSLLGVDAGPFQGQVGFNGSASRTDCMAVCLYAPTFGGRFSIGPVMKGHFLKYADAFVEHDFLVGLYTSVAMGTRWNFASDIEYLRKKSVMTGVSEKNRSMALAVRLDFFPNEDWDIFWTIKSTDDFTYQLFFSGILECGAFRQINDFVYVNCSGKIQFADIVTSLDGPNLAAVKIGLGVRL